MRIYTNYDIWKMSCHKIKYGILEYKDHLWNLDYKIHQFNLINQLLKDGIAKIIDSSCAKLTVKNLHEFHFEFTHQPLKELNIKNSGGKNKMQYLTLIINFKHYIQAKILK